MLFYKACSYTASEVSCTSSFLKILMSTSDSMTDVCAWHPASSGSWERARRACGFVAALADRAISTSSV